MMRVRRSDERGSAEFGWLSSRHTFSFGGYYDPKHMGFRALRVINEDRVLPGKGFDTHSHRDMEILSYVVEGALEHRDSMGNGSIIRPGELQLMRAGTGVTHSEYNPSPTEPVHFLQIWVLPSAEDLEPAYEQREFPQAERRGRLQLVASPDGAQGSLRIHQDVSLYATVLDEGQTIEHEIPPERFGWLQLVEGEMTVNGAALTAGDGIALSEENQVELRGTSAASEALFFDLG